MTLSGGVGREVVWKCSSRSKKGQRKSYSRQNGAAIQRDWSACIQRCQFQSWSLEAKEMKKNTIHFNGDSMNTELLFQNSSFCKSAQCLHCRSELVCTSWLDRGRERTKSICLWTKRYWQVYHLKKYNFWYLFQKWHLGALCNKIFRASKFCLTEFSSQSSMKTLGLNIVFQPDDVKHSTWRGRRFWAVGFDVQNEQLQLYVDQVETTRNTTLGLSSEKSTLKQDRTKSPELRRIDLSATPYTIMCKGFLPISCGIWGNVQKIDQIRTTDGEQLLLCVENTRVFDLIRKVKLWQLFLKAPFLDQHWKFILWKFLTSMG